MRHARITLIGCILAAAALVLTACSDEPASPSADAATRGTPTSKASPAAENPSGATPMAGLDGPLPAGPYAMIFIGDGDDSLPRAVVDVPTGYVTHGGYVIETDEHPYATRTVAFWLVDKVIVDPCRHYPLADPGPTPRDLVRALVAQPDLRVTEPVPVRVGGHEGLYVELTPRRASRVDDCTDGELDVWQSADPYQHSLKVPGTVDRVWILDVDGLRMVVTATSTPRVTAAQVDEMVAIAESVRFTGPANP